MDTSKRRVEFPYDPAIPLFGIHPKDSDFMFIEILFTTAKIWKQLSLRIDDSVRNYVTYRQ